ncbi:hypothetical protein TNCT_560051 [Trichonephila clavata]|uniref:Uncharacterized protein n=1 Tax=Trichonephila clavata TaxID=2740835 RepID=A0A8X6KWR7_TRICU|nr:hypothetical protein TNCT_560051 [Trichonephila clavata]
MRNDFISSEEWKRFCGDFTMDYEESHDNLSDAEPDSDHEDVDDPQKLLGTWLGELENLKIMAPPYRILVASMWWSNGS